jgi:chemotaxis protein methyltransferase CheR
VVGSDISMRVLARARSAHYPLERARHMPPACLKTYCLKGHGPQDGTLLVDRKLRARVSFLQLNLNEELPRLGSFDVIFLRNVMIYFNMDTKRSIVARVLSSLKPGGYFFISHSESLHGVTNDVRSIRPSLYRKS